MTATTLPSPAPGAAVAGVPGFRHGYTDVDGVRIHHVHGGSGPAVVLMHGWPLTWRAWQGLLAPLAAAGYTVIAPDLRGTGDSDRPERGYTKREVAADVRRVVEDLGSDEVRVVGMDIGTMVAYAYAADHRDSVRQLVLSESILPGFGLEEAMNPATGGHWHFGFHMQVDIAEFLTQGKEAAYIAPMLTMMTQRGLTDADRAEITAHYAAPGGMRGGFQHYGTLLEDCRDNRESGAAPLAMPVLVLNGEQGLPQQPLLDGARAAASTVVADTVPDAGHTFGSDNPTWTAQRLDRFFRTGQ
jgi:pimeloyl-ACP methyl ester carboxylesterase